MIEDAKKSKLIVLFNTLKEDDKDIVLTMAESLAKKCKSNSKNKESYMIQCDHKNQIHKR